MHYQENSDDVGILKKIYPSEKPLEIDTAATSFFRTTIDLELEPSVCHGGELAEMVVSVNDSKGVDISLWKVRGK